jgi:hypothetical protein
MFWYILFYLFQGEICIGLRSSDKKWYRVRNEGIFARKYGQEA